MRKCNPCQILPSPLYKTVEHSRRLVTGSRYYSCRSMWRRYREPCSRLSVSPVAEFLLACRSRSIVRWSSILISAQGAPRSCFQGFAGTVTLIGRKRTVQTVHTRCYCNLKLLGNSAQGKLNFKCFHMFRENKISSVWNPFNKLQSRIQINKIKLNLFKQ